MLKLLVQEKHRSKNLDSDYCTIDNVDMHRVGIVGPLAPCERRARRAVSEEYPKRAEKVIRRKHMTSDTERRRETNRTERDKKR